MSELCLYYIDEETYKSCSKCEPYFPSRSFCWRKKQGAFKFDTSTKLNEDCKYTFKILQDTVYQDVGTYINDFLSS